MNSPSEGALSLSDDSGYEKQAYRCVSRAFWQSFNGYHSYVTYTVEHYLLHTDEEGTHRICEVRRMILSLVSHLLTGMNIET